LSISLAQVLLLALLLAGCSDGSAVSRSSEESVSGVEQDTTTLPDYRVVAGYFPSWGDPNQIAKIDFSRLTHIIYAFYLPDSLGNIQTSDDWGRPGWEATPQDERLQELVALAHAPGNNVKVLVAVGGGSYASGYWGRFASTAEGRSNFVQSALKLMNEEGVDGIDIDWEYPNNTEESNAFQSLMEELRAGFDSTRSGLFLTAAVGASSYGSSYITAAGVAPCDWINIMTYDATGSWMSSPAGPTAPLSFAQTGSLLWQEKGVPLSRQALGIPFYGVNFMDTSFSSGRRITGTQIGYDDVVARFSPTRDMVKYPDGKVFWDSPTLVQQKTRWALGRRMRGVMIWELSQDARVDSLSLLAAIWDEMLQYSSELAKVNPGPGISYDSLATAVAKPLAAP
jgi:GH18 family chitinase